MAAFEAVHRTILVFDIEQSNHPMRTNRDRVVIHEAMWDCPDQGLSSAA
jgi:hypothetical protein